MCKVSVIVPVYNGENHLGSCLESLAVQTLEDIEIIVVNDGSTDGTLAIIERYVAKYSRFRLCSISNSGVSHARNLGVEMSMGDYLTFVDSDDRVEADYCRLMYEKAVEDNNDLVVCRHDMITLSDGRLTSIPMPDTLFDIDNYKMADHRRLFGSIAVCPWAKLIKRELADVLQFPEGIAYAEDRLFTAKAFCLAENIGTVNDTLYHYYYEIHNGVTSGFDRERLDWIRVMELIYDFMSSDKIAGTFDEELEYYMISKCIRLCSAAVIRINPPRELRIQIVKEIHEYLNERLPNWRNNPYYIAEMKKRAYNSEQPHSTYYNGVKVLPPFCCYGKIHLLFLIWLSEIVPRKTFIKTIEADQKLFFAYKKIYWKWFPYRKMG